jgi:hypothetical protein
MSALTPYGNISVRSGSARSTPSWLSTLRLDLPFACLNIALGMVLVAHGYTLARTEAPEALAFYWAGMAWMMLISGWRLMQTGLTRRERLLICLALGVALYFVKVMQHPTQFAYHDEHAHWRSALDIVRTGRLFNANPLLPVTPLYPGLAVATTVVSQVTELSLHVSSIVLLTAARIIMMLALFHLFEAVTRSERAAGLATLIYAANPNFLYFDGQFSYETLALPLALMLIYALLRSQNERGVSVPALIIVVSLTLLTNAMTHHFTSYMTVITLVSWSVVSLVLFRQRQSRSAILINMTLVAILVNVVWLLYVANFTLSYLAYVFQSAFEGLVSVASLARDSGGESGFRRPFESDGVDSGTPIYQRLLSFASVGFTVIGIPFGLWEVLRRRRTHALVLVMAGAMCLQPFMYVLRLTTGGAGWEVANRSAEFIFIGLAPVVALAIVNLRFPWWIDWIKRALIAPAIAIMLMGGVIVSTAPWSLLPWPYRPGSDQRSVEEQGISAARWSQEFLGADRRIIADRVNAQLFCTYGLQRLADGATIWPGLILTPRVDEYGLQIMRESRIEYVVSDLRMSKQTSFFGYYISELEQDIFRVPYPIPRASLEKYDHIAGAHRIFDSGGVVLYDVRALSDGR